MVEWAKNTITSWKLGDWTEDRGVEGVLPGTLPVVTWAGGNVRKLKRGVFFS